LVGAARVYAGAAKQCALNDGNALSGFGKSIGETGASLAGADNDGVEIFASMIANVPAFASVVPAYGRCCE